MQQSLELGALGFIPKSITSSVLLTAIQLVLAGGTYIPANLLQYLPKEGAEEERNKFESNSLTQRQYEVLERLRAGLSNKEIGRELNISEATVKAHVTVVLRSRGGNIPYDAAGVLGRVIPQAAFAV